MKFIPVEVSARHIHLSKDVSDVLFGENYEFSKKKDLSQPGQFACFEKVTIQSEKNEIKNATVLGPFREKTQIEISLTDARKLGVFPPIRESGDLENSSACKITGPKGECTISEGLIISKRHIHMSPEDAEGFFVKDNQIVKVLIESAERKTIFDDVVVRVSEKFSLAMHIDTDEGNAVNFFPDVKARLIYGKNQLQKGYFLKKYS